MSDGLIMALGEVTDSLTSMIYTLHGDT